MRLICYFYYLDVFLMFSFPKNSSQVALKPALNMCMCACLSNG